MFKSVISAIFPSIKSEKRPNYFYFEESKATNNKTSAEPIKSVIDKPEEPQSQLCLSCEEQHQKGFYDFLFGQSPPTKQHDELSLYVAEKIEHLLRQPKHILKSLPTLPMSLSKVIEQLNNEEFDTDELVKLIQQEPMIAAKVIELANSTFYNRSNKEVTDLKSAFMQLGAKGLMEGVINGFVSNFTPSSALYFKQYGNQIWQHSFSTGVIAKSLAEGSEHANAAPQAYLIGLVCNLGDMILFQLLIEAFSHVHPDLQPNSFAFKDLMFKNSKKLTYYIAKYWQFPTAIMEALMLQTKLTRTSQLASASRKYPVGCFVYEANILSELELRYQKSDITAEVVEDAREYLVTSKQAKEYIARMISEH